MTQQALKPLSFFKANPQVRKEFDETDLRRLGESLKVKQLQPVLCQPDGTIIAGERRYRAAKLVGMTHLEAKIADQPLSDSEVKLWQLTENLQRADLTGHEKWMGCSELMSLNPSWQQKDLADHLHLSESMVVRLLSPSRTIPAWRQALKEGKVGISDAYAASKLPDAEAQAALLTLKLSGASRDAIEHAGRKQRTDPRNSPDDPGVKVNRVKCLLSSGVQIVVSGKGVSLDESIDALAEAIREMKHARDLGYTSKTFAAAMKDKARPRKV